MTSSTADGGHLAGLRVRYDGPDIDPASMPADPLAAFTAWFDEVERAGLPEPNAVVLATVDAEGLPHARTVLVKGADERGLVVYTNFDSAKAHELAVRPQAALVFPWHPLARQVRVEGRVERVEDATADAYFASRPRESQLGAWASEQSKPAESRHGLDERYAETERRFGDEPVPRPPFWGGYRIVPRRWEFWSGKRGRLHDRVEYVRGDAHRRDVEWTRRRLQP
jgi:pyridoxamine 5'-phosphate oxidase